jgi:hypothetical protein
MVSRFLLTAQRGRFKASPERPPALDNRIFATVSETLDFLRFLIDL